MSEQAHSIVERDSLAPDDHSESAEMRTALLRLLMQQVRCILSFPFRS